MLLAGESETAYLFVVQVRVRLRAVICAGLSGVGVFVGSFGEARAWNAEGACNIYG